MKVARQTVITFASGLLAGSLLTAGVGAMLLHDRAAEREYQLEVIRQETERMEAAYKAMKGARNTFDRPRAVTPPADAKSPDK